MTSAFGATMRLALLVLSGSACTGLVPPPAASPTPVRLVVDGTGSGFSDPLVYSIDDANERFAITVVVTSPVDTTASHRFELVQGDLRLTSYSWGRGGDDVWCVFHAAPTAARSLARALGVPAHERPPWRGELTGSLEPVAPAVVGAATWPLRFTLTNTGPVALWFLDGGRQRNDLGRDNRFTFEIERDGERLATRPVGDFGGIALPRRLAPRDAWTFQIDLAHWCLPDRAGRYTVRATYEADLMPGDHDPGRVLPVGWHSHLQRVRNVEATCVLELRQP